MKINLSDFDLSDNIKKEISLLIESIDYSKSGLENIWMLMDLVWERFGCDNQKPDWDDIGKFYKHPVWLLNGLFIEQDSVSMQHRREISDYVVKIPSAMKILDYGGGFGTLARLIADKNHALKIDVFEPHPFEYSERKVSEYPGIKFIDEIQDKYDVLVSTDVLEHVRDPLRTLAEMIGAINDNGHLIIANNFYPVIKCHLPKTFHFRYTFNIFVILFFRLKYLGPLKGSHATVFRKKVIN